MDAFNLSANIFYRCKKKAIDIEKHFIDYKVSHSTHNFYKSEKKKLHIFLQKEKIKL